MNRGLSWDEIETRSGPDYSPEDKDTAEALLDYYQMVRGITYGYDKQEKYSAELAEMVSQMKEAEIDPFQYINWVTSEYEPPYINMVLSEMNLKRFAKNHYDTGDTSYFSGDKLSIRRRRDNGATPLEIYQELNVRGSPIMLFTLLKKGDVDSDLVDDYSELKEKAMIQWRVLNEEKKQDIVNFFDLDGKDELDNYFLN